MLRWTPQDQRRAWRLIAATADGDAAPFSTIVDEALQDGPDAVAAMAANFVIRVSTEIGTDALEELINSELARAVALTEGGGRGSGS